jgi:hypothetical protein
MMISGFANKVVSAIHFLINQKNALIGFNAFKLSALVGKCKPGMEERDLAPNPLPAGDGQS